MWPHLMTLSILYQDAHMVAVDKPPGLLVHRTQLAGEEEDYLLQLLRDQIEAYVYPIHRLDRPTSGVLLFGLSEEATRRLKAQFTEREVTKRYAAVVRGWLETPGEIDYALKKPRDHVKNRKKWEASEPQPARSSYRPLTRTEIPVPIGRYPTARYTYLQLTPHTGRTHQLRRHMAHISHPILGDSRYGDGAHNRYLKERFPEHRLMLCATELQFVHPFDQSRLAIRAPLPADFQSIVMGLGLETGQSPHTDD